MPKGAFSVITFDRKVGDIFVTDERLKWLSFTVGWDMTAQCGTKTVVLELGGSAACVVDNLKDDSLAGIDEIICEFDRQLLI